MQNKLEDWRLRLNNQEFRQKERLGDERARCDRIIRDIRSELLHVETNILNDTANLRAYGYIEDLFDQIEDKPNIN